MNNRFTIFTNDCSDKIDIIYDYLLQNNYYDICIVTENSALNIDKKYAILYSFYLKFYKGSIIFLDIKDYIDNQYLVDHLNKYVVCTPQEIIDSKLDKYSLKNVKIININNNMVEIQ